MCEPATTLSPTPMAAGCRCCRQRTRLAHRLCTARSCGCMGDDSRTPTTTTTMLSMRNALLSDWNSTNFGYGSLSCCCSTEKIGGKIVAIEENSQIEKERCRFGDRPESRNDWRPERTERDMHVDVFPKCWLSVGSYHRIGLVWTIRQCRCVCDVCLCMCRTRSPDDESCRWL